MLMRTRYASRARRLAGTLLVGIVAAAVYVEMFTSAERVSSDRAARRGPRLARFTGWQDLSDSRASAASIGASPRQLLNSDTIHIFHSICAGATPVGDPGFHGLTVVNTILQARETGSSYQRKYHFHIAIDGGMRRLMDPANKDSRLMQEFWDTYFYALNYTGGKVAVSWYDIDGDISRPMNEELGQERSGVVQNGLFKDCSTTRLRLPFIKGPLAAADRVIYIDMDAVVKCDLERLWEEQFAAMDEQQMLGFSEESPHAYYPSSYKTAEGVKFPSKYETGLNGGVFIARLDRWRQQRLQYWDEVVDIVRKDGYTAYNMSVWGKGGLTFGDQVHANKRQLNVKPSPHVVVIQSNVRNRIFATPPSRVPSVPFRFLLLLCLRRTSSTSCPTASRSGSTTFPWLTTGGWRIWRPMRRTSSRATSLTCDPQLRALSTIWPTGPGGECLSCQLLTLLRRPPKERDGDRFRSLAHCLKCVTWAILAMISRSLMIYHHICPCSSVSPLLCSETKFGKVRALIYHYYREMFFHPLVSNYKRGRDR